jgi:hypothetical protein
MASGGAIGRLRPRAGSNRNARSTCRNQPPIQSGPTRKETRWPCSSSLLKQTDCNGREIYYHVSDLVRYELRLRAEVAEIRSAVAAMRVQGGTFLEEVADFLDREALQLERVNEADGDNDTRERDGYVPTTARRALLIARAFTSTHPALSGEAGPGRSDS